MTQTATRPSVPVAIASILLVAGLAATALVLNESPSPFAPDVSSGAVPGASGGVPVALGSATPSASPVVVATGSPVPGGSDATSGSPGSSPGASVGPLPSAELPSAEPSASPDASVSPDASAAPSASATPSPTPRRTPDRAANVTRVAIETLGVDLPVIAPAPGERQTRCGVAEYLQQFGTPAQGRTTYLYGNALVGMFLPVLQTARTDAASLRGQEIMVWTDDDFLWIYVVDDVKRHQNSLDWAFNLPARSLVVQTSDDGGKLMLVASLSSRAPSEDDAAHPVAKPRACR